MSGCTLDSPFSGLNGILDVWKYGELVLNRREFQSSIIPTIHSSPTFDLRHYFLTVHCLLFTEFIP